MVVKTIAPDIKQCQLCRGARVLVYKATVDGFMKFYESEKRLAAVRGTTKHDFSRRSQSIFKMAQYCHGSLNSMNLGWEGKDEPERLWRHDSENLSQIRSQF